MQSKVPTPDLKKLDSMLLQGGGGQLIEIDRDPSVTMFPREVRFWRSFCPLSPVFKGYRRLDAALVEFCCDDIELTKLIDKQNSAKQTVD